MDDTQNTHVNSVINDQAQPVHQPGGQPVQSQPGPAQKPWVEEQPVVDKSAGRIEKEQEPVPSVSSSFSWGEHIKPSQPELHVSSELKEAGVETIEERPLLTPEDHAVGIQHVKETTPVITQPTGAVALPMTAQQAQQTLKLHKKITESIVWLASLVLKQFKMQHQKEKHVD